MKDDIYTMKRLCKELDQPIQKIRRRLVKLDIEAINEDTRVYKNDPLEYSYQTFVKLAEEFNISVSKTKFTSNEQKCTTEDLIKDKIIKVLEEQLKEANSSRENLEKLLDQQQKLTLQTSQQIERLQLGIDKPNNETFDLNKKQGFFSRLFKF